MYLSEARAHYYSHVHTRRSRDTSICRFVWAYFQVLIVIQRMKHVMALLRIQTTLCASETTVVGHDAPMRTITDEPCIVKY